MLEFNLPDMSCGHCASTVTQTCKLVDPAAKVEVDVGAKRVKVETNEVLAEAGYPPA